MKKSREEGARQKDEDAETERVWGLRAELWSRERKFEKKEWMQCRKKRLEKEIKA